MWCLKALLDLAGIYRTWNSKYNNWSVFGQDHVARVLLKYPEAQTHDAVGDALKSIRLYHLSRQLQQDPAVWQQAQVKLGLNSLFLTSWLLLLPIPLMSCWTVIFHTCLSPINRFVKACAMDCFSHCSSFDIV